MISGDRDLDLHLRAGRPPEGELAETADLSAVGEGPHEMLRVAPEGDALVRPGPWYVAVENHLAPQEGATFEVVAFVDRQGGRRTLLPGAPVTVTVPTPGRAFAMRTWLPRRVTGAVLDLDLPVLEGLRFRAEGPGGYARRETTQQRILLGSEDAPRGIYTVSLSAPAPLDREPRLTARLTWSFPGGLVLPLPPSPLLEPGRLIPVLMGGPANGSVQPLRLLVPPGSGGFVLTAATTGGANVDLFVWRGAPPTAGTTPPSGSASPSARSSAWWSPGRPTPRRPVPRRGPPRGGRAPGRGDRLDAAARDSDRGVLLGRDRSAGARPRRVGGRDREGLRLGLPWHAVDAPEGAASIHAQLLDASGPLELAFLDPEDGRIAARAFTPLVDEQLELPLPAPLPRADPLLPGGLEPRELGRGGHLPRRRGLRPPPAPARGPHLAARAPCRGPLRGRARPPPPSRSRSATAAAGAACA